MTTYLGEKAVGIGTIKATKAVAGDVLHDGTLVGNGNTEPLGVNKQVIATTNQVANLVSNIESKIPESASETNQLITKADLKDIDLDGCVKKSGDTMTGDLGIVSDTYKTSANISVEGARGRMTIRVSDSEEPGVYSQFELNRSGTFVARTISGTSINYGKVGAPDVPMYNVYTKRLNNGADLIVPSEGGTLARVEDLTDLQDALGDAISAHNTAINAHSNIRGVAGGLATLDSNAKVPMSQINDSLLGNVSYQGLWNAATNTPFLADPSGDIQLPKGHYYITSVAGDRFGLHFDVGDWIISTGEGWTKVDNTDAVVAVNGRTGNVVLGANDVGAYTKEEVDALVGSGGGSMPTRYVESINGFTGNVFLGCREIGTYTSVEIDAMIGDIASVLDSINGEGA